jgi:5-methylthioadenosine/S-adenosylhomocysteine deaminase
MERVNTLLTGGIVVTMDEAFRLYPDGAAAIQAEKIIAVGTSDKIAARFEADEVIDCRGKYVLPGLINAHTHAAMTLLRGLADDLRLDVWLMGYCMPTEREFVNPEFCRLGTSIACAEMIRCGITCFADMYYYEAEVAAATAAAGMRGVLGETILKFPAPDAPSYEDSLDYTREFIKAWKGHALITPAVAPHAPYSNTAETLRRCTELAVEYDVPLLTHLAETKLEVDDVLRNTEMRVIPYMKQVKLFDAKVLAAHCVHIETTEIHLLRDNGATAAHCPTSNLKLASGIAPLAKMLESHLIVGIGTDGPASNNDLDMFEEIRLAAVLAKTAAEDPTAVPAREALLMATRQGAQALFLGDVTGSLEADKLADVIVVDANAVHNMPHFQRDPNAVYSQIVYASKSSDVRHVMCHGQWLMRDRELLTLNEEALLEQATEYALKVDAFLSAREQDVLSKLLAIGGLQQEESFEVQVKAVLPDEGMIIKLLSHPDVQIVKQIHYRQYDTYFLFDEPEESRVRYREDYLLNGKGETVSVRSRLTYTVPSARREFASTVMLSQSRFIADADRPLRFYREYFQPTSTRELQKDRQRSHILYKGVLFYVNVDRVEQPEIAGAFVEIKSRTWSASDAEEKVTSIHEMLAILGLGAEAVILADYLQMARVM